jgi:hypothetical protein
MVKGKKVLLKVLKENRILEEILPVLAKFYVVNSSK